MCPPSCWFEKRMATCIYVLTIDRSIVRPVKMPSPSHALRSLWTHCSVHACSQLWIWPVAITKCLQVTEADRSKTAFCTPFGMFEWNRMPFGLCNTPSTFQSLMQCIFGNQQCQSLLLYLDDVVNLVSSTVQQHLERLKVVLEQLQHESLKAKLSKCSFFCKEVRYFGHVISAEGVSTD